MGRPMSERTFRAVVAAVLIGALVLASVVAFAVLQPPSPSPTPGATPTVRPTATARPTPAPTPTPTPQLVFEEVGLTAVGSVPRGGASGATLVLRFLEPSVDAIPNAAGSFTVTLTDHAGGGATLAFTGVPSLGAPGSLGVKAELAAGNVLEISIVAADVFNIEPITVTGLGISASPEAALGSINATLGAFTGSLAGGVAKVVLPSPGSVVAGQ
jgi:hypothetical protein